MRSLLEPLLAASPANPLYGQEIPLAARQLLDGRNAPGLASAAALSRLAAASRRRGTFSAAGKRGNETARVHERNCAIFVLQ